MSAPGFWDTPDSARDVIAEVNELKGWASPVEDLSAKAQELTELVELLEAEPDAGLEAEWSREVEQLEHAVEQLELRTMLRGADDHRDALLTIHPGAGGTESQDWAEMLMRMYSRWAERRGYQVTVLDLQPGEEAGIKDVTLEIKGQHAYGYLKAEKGVHRLVRISPFDAQSRRHTSFASVFVYPVVDDTIEIDIDEGDLRCGRVPRFRCGRSARQQDQLGGAHHARADRHRGYVPERAQPVPEQGHCHERCCARNASRSWSCGSGTAEGGSDQDRHRLGQPDPLLRAPALHTGHGTPDRAQDWRCAAGDGW
jgi:hypothetical protein